MTVLATYTHPTVGLPHVHAWCVRDNHWHADGSHVPPISGTPADPVWSTACNLRVVTVLPGGKLTIDSAARNGWRIEQACLAHGAARSI